MTLITTMKQPPAMPNTMSDEALVRSAQEGSQEAFARLIERYERPVRALCWSVLRDHHLACDASQDAFIEGYRRLKHLRKPVAFGAWIITIARRRALRIRRYPHHRLQRSNVDGPLAEAPAKPVTALEEGLSAAVAQLPRQERLVILLKFFDGYDVEEIAEILQRPVGTVTKQLSRAYARLRAKLLIKE